MAPIPMRHAGRSTGWRPPSTADRPCSHSSKRRDCGSPTDIARASPVRTERALPMRPAPLSGRLFRRLAHRRPLLSGVRASGNPRNAPGAVPGQRRSLAMIETALVSCDDHLDLTMLPADLWQQRMARASRHARHRRGARRGLSAAIRAAGPRSGRAARLGEQGNSRR